MDFRSQTGTSKNHLFINRTRCEQIRWYLRDPWIDDYIFHVCNFDLSNEINMYFKDNVSCIRPIFNNRYTQLKCVYKFL